MDTSGVIQLISLFLLLLLSGFFSSAETSLTTVNKVRIRTLCEEGNRRAQTTQKILDNYSKMLSTILIGNNIVNITASSLATTLAIKIWGSFAVGIVTGVLTILVLLFGEIIPKNLAMIYSEKISLAYSGIIYLLMQLFTPVIIIVDVLSNLIMKLLHIDPNKKVSTMTESELKTYVDVSHEDGVIESEEREIIYNVFDFSDAVAKDIMIPRIDMVTVDLDTKYEDLLKVFRESMYTRIPVYEEDKDNVIGLVNIKDFILVTDEAHFHIKDIIREAHYTYEFKKTADLMVEMREKTTNVAFVLNEYGSTVGMITLEDLLEEIVGEIRDEYDEDEDEFIKSIDANTYLVEGGMKLDDINDALEISLKSEDYDSLGGLMIEKLDRLPEEDEEIELESGIRLKAQGIVHNRITKVLLTIPEKTPDTEENLSEETEQSAIEKEN
ncbi:MAG: HlyC/CorC family transporter [Lachnospiraceae bacterium]|nr:HlyC/CorC family transporter [Lachnospiraceae bacterium]